MLIDEGITIIHQAGEYLPFVGRQTQTNGRSGPFSKGLNHGSRTTARPCNLLSRNNRANSTLPRSFSVTSIRKDLISLGLRNLTKSL